MPQGPKVLEEAKQQRSHSQRPWCFRTIHSSGHQSEYFLGINSTPGHIGGEWTVEVLLFGLAKDVSCDAVKPKCAHLSEG